MEFTLSQIAQICSGRYYGVDRKICSVLTDSRKVVADAATSLFVAINGVNHDAHDYIDDMVCRGLTAFLTEREVELPAHCGMVVVDNALAALQKLAAYRRDNFGGVVAAITGSNGKTVVKEWIAHALGSQIKFFRSPRSYNSQLGVALSLLMVPDDCQVALIEAGISKPGEMLNLYNMIRPDVTIFTTLGDAHQANFNSEEQKLSEKLLLSADTIIYNSAYSTIAKAVEAKFSDRKLIDAATISVPTHYDAITVNNARLVAAFCQYCGCSEIDMTSLPPVAMRLEVKPGANDNLIVNDSYSCDVDSLVIALDYLDSVAQSRDKVVILSDILQSGLNEEQLYRLVAEQMAIRNISLFVGVGEAISKYSHYFTVPTRFYSTTEQLLGDISHIEPSNAAILIKGNRQARTERISHRLELKSHTTVLEVNLRAMERNINYFRSKIAPTTKMTAMVKASGYGTGDAEVAQMLCKQGIDYLAVAFADEGALLRQQGITMPIVVLNADDHSFDIMVEHHLEPEIYSFRSLDAFAQAVELSGELNYPVHLKFDTGMHRLGFMQSDVPALLERLDRYNQHLRVASLFTHLCVADDPCQDAFTRSQIALFDALSAQVQEHCGYPILRHAAASAAIIRFPEAHFDMCRLGLGMYGFGYEYNPDLEPISTLRTRVVQIRDLDAGQSVGYGRAGVVERRSRIATIPIGYADGLDRHLGCGAWSMVVNGHKAPTVGRICMDSCMVDITDIDGVQEGDEVVIFSAMPGNSAEDMAAILDTIPYEVLTSISKRVKRIYIYE